MDRDFGADPALVSLSFDFLNRLYEYNLFLCLAVRIGLSRQVFGALQCG